MLVRHAKDLARQWVLEEGVNTPGFVGAYHTGSINWQTEDDVIAATSDVDVMVVCEAADERGKLGKFGYGGAILEVSYTSAEQLQSAEQILGNYHLAGGFHVPSVIAGATRIFVCLVTCFAVILRVLQLVEKLADLLALLRRRLVRRQCL